MSEFNVPGTPTSNKKMGEGRCPGAPRKARKLPTRHGQEPCDDHTSPDLSPLRRVKLVFEDDDSSGPKEITRLLLPLNIGTEERDYQESSRKEENDERH